MQITYKYWNAGQAIPTTSGLNYGTLEVSESFFTEEWVEFDSLEALDGTMRTWSRRYISGELTFLNVSDTTTFSKINGLIGADYKDFIDSRYSDFMPTASVYSGITSQAFITRNGSVKKERDGASRVLETITLEVISTNPS